MLSLCQARDSHHSRMNFEDLISVVGKAIDGAGVAAIVVGAIFVSSSTSRGFAPGRRTLYREFRHWSA